MPKSKLKSYIHDGSGLADLMEGGVVKGEISLESGPGNTSGCMQSSGLYPSTTYPIDSCHDWAGHVSLLCTVGHVLSSKSAQHGWGSLRGHLRDTGSGK